MFDGILGVYDEMFLMEYFQDTFRQYKVRRFDRKVDAVLEFIRICGELKIGKTSKYSVRDLRRIMDRVVRKENIRLIAMAYKTMTGRMHPRDTVISYSKHCKDIYG